ncbi:MAG TPA: helicase-related protein, partial [Ktedonobacteraceae bacterium]|nr:helicase-related protein [Ktedonobacteraceae bacterium]
DEDDEDEDEWQDSRKRKRNAQQAESASEDDAAGTGQDKPAKRQPERKAPEPGETLTMLRDADLLPCLYFLPGRRVVEESALSAALHLFTTPEEQQLIREEIGMWLETLPKEDRSLQQVYELTELLPRGIAFHHAGLLPGLKVLVETLFARGLLRAVFATDTLALGVNMPARSVVVGSLSKFDGQEMRLLTPNEYRQLTGRAGRRGMDIHGAAIILYSPWEPFEDAFKRITGELLPVTSSFVVRYNSVLNLWRPGDVQHLRRVCASSLREYQRYREWEQREMARLERLEMRYHTGKKSKKREKAAEGALEALEKRRKIIGAYPLSRAGAAELDGTIFTLRALGYIGQDDQLTLKGRLLKSMYHHAGIFIVELITQGLLDELTPGELAEVCSWFTFDSERRLNNRHVLGRSLTRVRSDLWRTMQHIYGVEERAGLSFSPNIFADFHGVALSWARGMSLNGLLRRIDLAEGDLLMLLNQTIDLLQQVQAAVGQLLDARGVWEQFSPLMTDGQLDVEASDKRGRVRLEQLRLQRERLERLRPLLAQASAALLHGIIIQSRTIPSMAARMQEPAVPLDAEEDIEPSDIEPV